MEVALERGRGDSAAAPRVFASRSTPSGFAGTLADEAIAV